MREFDSHLLSILKTEVPGERRLRLDPEERRQYMAGMVEGSGNPEVYDTIKHNVSVTRKPRYVACPPHRTGMLEMIYMVSGSVRFTVGNRELMLNTGDFFLPNLYTMVAWDAPGENDIMVSFNMKAQFLEDTCVKLRTNTALSEFLLDTLRRDVSWNRYLHFANVTDLGVRNLAETLIYASFPYLNEENMGCGSAPDPEITAYMMCSLFVALSRNLETLTEDSTTNYTEALRQTVCDYIATEYQTASLQELSRMLSQSESALSRRIKEIFGFNFKELLLQKRFERAVVLLEHTQLSVADIAQSVGYENTSFFYRRFHQIYGISPSDYRKQEQREQTE